MYLGDVNIEGFKSFSEKTSMGFKPGIGVIIGNNGVGKSNILDAIVWALGEDDLERIRCYDRKELFFAGSKDYPPADTVAVELNFRESEDKDAPTYKLSRELHRDGRSSFTFQDEPLAREAYLGRLEEMGLREAVKTIIRQEQINNILLADPARRFEMVQAMLGARSSGEAAERLQDTVTARFERYMAYLMPLSQTRIELPSFNGRKALDIEVALPGNRVRRAHQLSGGEKSITSLALKLALFHELQSPFYLLDEVEPSLDYVNHKSMQAFLKDVANDKQLIMITHLRSTIDLANTLHGVRTRFDGSSFMKFYFVMDKRLLMLYKCC